MGKPDPPSKRALAREYDVSEGAIRKTWENREVILIRSSLMSEEARCNSYRTSIGLFSQLEDMLYAWIDSMQRASLPVPPSLAITKAKKIVEQLGLSENDFKASWQWLCRFRACKGLQKMLLHGEGAEVNRDNPDLIAKLNELHGLIKEYDPENVYNMDETRLILPNASKVYSAYAT